MKKIKATSQQHDILLLLIEKHPKRVSVLDIVNRTYALNHTARIDNLRKKGVEIVCTHFIRKNKYGRTSKHTFYHLTDIAKSKEIELKLRNKNGQV